MEFIRVDGSNNQHSVRMYALSTCVWCKKTKKLLNDNDITYEYIDVDLLDEMERQQATDEMIKLGSMAFPTLIIDGEVITGFDQQKIRKSLDLPNG
jgi:glutaredoxin